MDDEREVTDLEQAEAELEECQNDLIDVAKQRDAALARAESAEAALAELQDEIEEAKIERDAQRFRAEQIEAMTETQNVLDLYTKLNAAVDRAQRAEENLAACDQEYKHVEAQARKCSEAGESLSLRAQIAEEARRMETWRADAVLNDLAALQTPCVWRVEAPAHFVGHMDDKPLEMILVATSCGKGLGVQLPPPYCAYCGHPVEMQQEATSDKKGLSDHE